MDFKENLFDVASPLLTRILSSEGIKKKKPHEFLSSSCFSDMHKTSEARELLSSFRCFMHFPLESRGKTPGEPGIKPCCTLLRCSDCCCLLLSDDFVSPPACWSVMFSDHISVCQSAVRSQGSQASNIFQNSFLLYLAHVFLDFLAGWRCWV